ncbi:TPA: hypothetical protein N0F65_007749 [Lagenidium giganteum]|uniref:Uncharacterized protein n=1 Tax=Lagenidium giganteum TaxID=4803 RepID=A0AAV2Z7J7_9STRA|nr:TPA: hypothetical protein N0F65_007749 [Lagenidium giganteum]
MWLCATAMDRARATTTVLSLMLATAVAAAGYSRVYSPGCDWDIKVCVDGTWVYRDPDNNCAFKECVVLIEDTRSSLDAAPTFHEFNPFAK